MLVDHSFAAFRIWTANLLYLSERPDLVVPLIVAAAPDIILLQELTPPMARHLADAFGASHPHTILDPDPGPDGFGIFSRFPVAPRGNATLVGGSQFLQTASMEAPLGVIDLYNVHLVSPVDPRAIRRQGVRGVGRLREAQATEVARRVAGGAGPAVIAGDLNAWPGRPAVCTLASVARDAWELAGRGRGATWPRRTPGPALPTPPIFRLDYCFFTAGLTATSVRVVTEPTGSDHCPLVVDVIGA